MPAFSTITGSCSKFHVLDHALVHGNNSLLRRGGSSGVRFLGRDFGSNVAGSHPRPEDGAARPCWHELRWAEGRGARRSNLPVEASDESGKVKVRPHPTRSIPSDRVQILRVELSPLACWIDHRRPRVRVLYRQLRACVLAALATQDIAGACKRWRVRWGQRSFG